MDIESCKRVDISERYVLWVQGLLNCWAQDVDVFSCLSFPFPFLLCRVYDCVSYLVSNVSHQTSCIMAIEVLERSPAGPRIGVVSGTIASTFSTIFIHKPILTCSSLPVVYNRSSIDFNNYSSVRVNLFKSEVDGVVYL